MGFVNIMDDKPAKKFQELCKADDEFRAENPEWDLVVREVIRQWNRQEKSLNHAIGDALRDAYDRGTKGLGPPEIEPPSTGMPLLVRRRK
jgi:hypothetical protein